jgi:hypothetical protein
LRRKSFAFERPGFNFRFSFRTKDKDLTASSSSGPRHQKRRLQQLQQQQERIVFGTSLEELIAKQGQSSIVEQGT